MKMENKKKDWYQQGDVIIEPLSARGMEFPTQGKPGIKTVRQALAWRNGIDTAPAVLT
jgi:hypothetical protein